MNPFDGYPFGPVKVRQDARTQARPWTIIEALVDHATWAGRPVTRRNADSVLALLTQAGSHETRHPLGARRELVVTTTAEPRVTWVTVQPARGST